MHGSIMASEKSYRFQRGNVFVHAPILAPKGTGERRDRRFRMRMHMFQRAKALLYQRRRYLYFNVWRARARLLETDFYAPMLRGEGAKLEPGWTELLAKDYCHPRYHISFARAIGRRLRRTYAWIFIIQAIAYYGKLAIHPVPLTSLTDIWQRAAIGPIPGTCTSH